VLLAAMLFPGSRELQMTVLVAKLHRFRFAAPQVLTPRNKFLYNSGLFRIRARGGRTRESLHAPRCAHYKQEKIHWAQQFFWIDHEDVFRKSP
jgi:hypothetical protein